MEKNKVVYIHRNPTTNEIFYVGMGAKYRPYSKDRSIFWKRYVKKHGSPTIEIVESNITKKDAWESEIALIELIGRRDKRKGTLVNLSDGGEGGLNTVINIGVIDLNTGRIFGTSTEASKFYGVQTGHLSNHLSGKKPIQRLSHLRGINRDGTIRWQSDDDDGFDYEDVRYGGDNYIEELARNLDACGNLDGVFDRSLGFSNTSQMKNKLKDYIKKIMF